MNDDAKAIIQQRFYKALLRIFIERIEAGQRLSPAEKDIVRQAKALPDKNDALLHLTKCFFERDLR